MDNNKKDTIVIDRKVACVAFDMIRQATEKQHWTRPPYIIEWAQWQLGLALGYDDHDEPPPCNRKNT